MEIDRTEVRIAMIRIGTNQSPVMEPPMNAIFEAPSLHLKNLETKGLEFARSAASAAEFVGDTIRGESRNLATRARKYVTAKLTGHKLHSGICSESDSDSDLDSSLEPLAGVGTGSASVGHESL
jgi:hypothetical protein